MKLKEKNAISLIVLVITILVLSILAATVIISLSNTNIISQANDAVKKTEAQQIEETKTLMYADGMLGNTPEAIVIGDTTLTWDTESKTIIEKATSNGVTTVDKVTIPDGFYYVGGTKDTGLVISDNSADENKGVDYTCEGNQFVWVPVDDYSKFVRGEAEETYDGSGVYKMTRALDAIYTEPDASGYFSEQEDYDAMCASVQKCGGFYIARFEAGDEWATEPRTNSSNVSTVVSKKGVYVYNYVPWGDSMSDIGTTGAVYLSQNMYIESTSVSSRLCYGVQWDAVMNFVSDASHDITNSASWGNYSNSTGDAATNSGSLQKTGTNEAWKAKNIYDLAGNAQEWTMEAYSPSNRVARGGCFAATINPASSRSAWDVVDEWDYPGSTVMESFGFRPTLYIVVK